MVIEVSTDAFRVTLAVRSDHISITETLPPSEAKRLSLALAEIANAASRGEVMGQEIAL